MDTPGLADLRRERGQMLATLAGLPEEDFLHGPTLCGLWAPAQILAHQLAIDDHPLDFVRYLPSISRANEVGVGRFDGWSRERLLDRALSWAETPPPTTRAMAWFLLGDCAVHHQDVLRPRSLRRTIPDASKLAMLREGLITMGGVRKLGRYRLEPTDIGRHVGRGTTVTGTAEAIGLWLCGRDDARADLTFS